ncbi:putative dehydrogenase [Friedmanniella endophytica]|uniref:Putative dehydrogenase n=1 Tax=Microlunatus kandeliicorticis TaxID=1759536 RepID=A0A7W3IPH4_9ACTN|nr:Gfo/Idh/MocA family oxidoreductase [Microlunatus kandeliicorticis]MBA8792800.1 putative dehydrogenase [Microlunatus kandeliicorticis]
MTEPVPTDAGAQPIRVAVLSFWHVHAGDYARSTVEHPGTELVAVWDDDAERGRAGAERFGVEFVADLDALLARDDVDAVTVTTETSVHADVMTRAARAGKHVFTEKLLAPTVEEAEQIIAACDQAGVKLIVSLPRLYHGYTAAIDQVLADGKLGTLDYGRVRLSHDGATAGWLPDRFFDPDPSIGGALTDLGCHPVYLTQRFLGARPTDVQAVYRSVTGKAVEDNAVVTVGYDSGAIGVIEAGFAARTPFSIELAGTQGWLRYSDDTKQLTAIGAAFGDGPVTLEIPADAEDAFGQWVGHIRDGGRADANLEAAVELTRLVVAANRAAGEGRTVAP